MVVVVAVVLVVELTVRLLVVMVVVDLECVKTARYQERVFCVGGSRAPSAAGWITQTSWLLGLPSLEPQVACDNLVPAGL